MTCSDYALICKALGDETRAKIFEMLKSGTMCACKILDAFCFTQPTLSYHMKLLTDSGLVLAQREGKWMHYSLNKHVLNCLSEFLTLSDGLKKEVNC